MPSTVTPVLCWLKLQKDRPESATWQGACDRPPNLIGNQPDHPAYILVHCRCHPPAAPPSAGAYLAPDFPDPSSSSAPAFTMAGRPAYPGSCQQSGAAVPWPGTYQTTELPKGPAYSLPVAGRQVAGGREAGGAERPGPGAYEVAAGDSGARAWTIRSKVSSSGAAGACLCTRWQGCLLKV